MALTDSHTGVPLLLLPLLYAEIHHRLPGLFSRLWMDEPEILADLPHRLEPGAPLPLLILVKDAHRFAIELERVDVNFAVEDAELGSWSHSLERKPLSQPLWHRIMHPEIPHGLNGPIAVDVTIEYRRRGILKTCRSDNYRRSSHRPFTVFFDSSPLPGRDRCHYGDLHVHTAHTSDQVEFGAPLDATTAMARAMGLSFYAVTDHSYDLDDRPDDYLSRDPALVKWNELCRLVEAANESHPGFVILPGEELSVGNAAGRNIHLLLLNNRSFVPGEGDGAEHWLHNRPTMPLARALAGLERQALAFCAHPEIPAPLLQWLLIRRGKWKRRDYGHARLNGLQIWNGVLDRYFNRGVKRWTSLLLQGRRLSIVAGNDAHGNFGQFRQVGLPLWKLNETGVQLFGRARTGVLTRGPLTRSALTEALRQGRTLVTDGPFADLQLVSKSGSCTGPGETINAPVKIRLTALSSPAFGGLAKIILHQGHVGDRAERSSLIEPGESRFELEIEKNLPDPPGRGYVRLEVVTCRQRRALTNPVYIGSRAAES